jgi:hypothetical protein
VAFSGQDPRAYLREKDSFERSIMQVVAEKHLKLVQDFQEDLARRIIKTLGESMKK